MDFKIKSLTEAKIYLLKHCIKIINACRVEYIFLNPQALIDDEQIINLAVPGKDLEVLKQAFIDAEDDLFWQDSETETCDCILLQTAIHICLNGSEWLRSGYEDLPIHQGIYLKIIPVFSLPQNKFKKLMVAKKLREVQKILTNYTASECYTVSDDLWHKLNLPVDKYKIDAKISTTELADSLKQRSSLRSQWQDNQPLAFLTLKGDLTVGKNLTGEEFKSIALKSDEIFKKISEENSESLSEQVDKLTELTRTIIWAKQFSSDQLTLASDKCLSFELP